MRRKNRKWVATAVALYLFVMWSAYRWSIAQRPTDGPIFEHIQREEARKDRERRAREAQEQAKAEPQPTRESRLNAAGPAFVAARYDAAHIVFLVATDTETRFSASPLSRFGGKPTKVPAPSKPTAPLAGLQELWEPDSHSLHFFPEIVQQTQPGKQWTLSLSPDSSIPVTIERVVLAPTGCSLGIGFLASVPPDQQASFAAARDYFVIRHNAVESADPPVAAHIAELPDWKASSALAKQIERQLRERMKQEIAAIDARLRANAASPGAAAGEFPIGNARPRLKEWIHADQGLTRGEGALDYDLRAFRLTPDGAPRLFVRARWKLADAPVFLMTAWFKADSSKADSPKAEPPAGSASGESSGIRSSHGNIQPVLLFSDASWSLAMREGEAAPSLGDRLDFQTILNEFDADHDGWAELLIHSYDPRSNDAHSGPASSTTIAPYLYTDVGLVPLKAPLRRDLQSPESCLDP